MPVRLYVVRHAHAGSRRAWEGHDDLRPLSGKGHKQAAAIADLLEDSGVRRLVSSPSLRCTQTFAPLAARLALPVEADPRLAEGSRGEDALRLARDALADSGTARGRSRRRDEGVTDVEVNVDVEVDVAVEGVAVAVCSHGDVIPELLRLVRATTCAFADPLVWPKASTWVLTHHDDRWTRARYLPPPEIRATGRR
ncbi:MAG TPA: histidine phosphatase family protein [Acidimicrobiales bacterium]|nr:histidine phosphatase family protein [Acidimicrobiales bacterium]